MPRQRETLAIAAPVPSLACHGHSPDADLIYRYLATCGPRTSAAVARDLGVATARVAAALDELAAERAVVTPTADGAWAAAAPATVRNRLRSRRVAAVRPVSAATGGRMPARTVDEDVLALGDDVRYLPSRAATRTRLAKLVTVARHELIGMHPERTFDAESLRSAAPMDRALLARGVHMRVLGTQAGPDHAAHFVPPSGAGPSCRLSSDLPAKLLVIDRKVALFPVSPHDLGRGYLEVVHEPVVSALVAMFERHWAAAEDLQECPVPHVTLTPRERTLITLLAAGHTDASAGRELRISTRSISNILRGLMDRVGVENRFQLGLVLGAAHAVSPPTRPGGTPEEDR